MSRLTIRLNPALAHWIGEGGVEQADTARALIVLGAAAAGFPGAEREALRLLSADLDPRIATALHETAAKRQPSGSQAAATPAPPPATVQYAITDDPLAGVGIEV